MKTASLSCLFAVALFLVSAGHNSARAETEPTPADPNQSIVEPTGALTLRDVVAATLVGNPDLATFSWEMRTREAQTIQAGLLPNPEILVELENLGGSGDRAEFEQVETTIWLSQLIPIGGKRAERRRVAELERDLSQWDYEEIRLAVLTNATKAFVATLTAQRQLDLLRELERLAENSVRELNTLAAKGGASLIEVRRAKLDLSVARVRCKSAEGALRASRSALVANWGRTTARFSSAVGDLTRLDAVPALSELERRVAENPELARWETELDRQAAALSLEEARRVPDPTFSLGGRHFNDNGDSAVVFAVSVPLPIFDRNQGNVLAATRGVSKARAQRASAEISIRSRVQQRYAELVSAHSQAEILRSDTLPAAEQAFAATTEGHQQGLFNLLEVIEAERTLFELRAQYVDTISSYHGARADLEQLTGAGFETFETYGEKS